MAAVSKNVYFDVLDNIVDKFNNTVHRSIKTKTFDVKSDSSAEYNEDSNFTKPKLVIVLEFQNMKTFLLKYTRKIDQKKFLLLTKLKIQFCGSMLFVS